MGFVLVPIACIAVVFLFIFTVAFFMLRSWRGAPSLSEPRCAKCKYDLRGFSGAAPIRCSECGADLTARHAILWGRLEPKPKRLWIGLAVLVSPVIVLPLLFLGIRAVAVRGSPAWTGANSPGTPGFAARSNAQVIVSLGTSANAPWDWQELERRLGAGTLSNLDITDAIDKLIAFLKTQTTTQPLDWANQFFEKADAAGKIPDEQFQRLSQAFFKSCTVSVAGSTRAGAKLPITVKGAGPWQLNGYEYVCALRQVALTGASVLTLSSDRNPNPRKPDPDFFSAKAPWDISANTSLKIPPGSYTLVFTIDVAVLHANTAPMMVQGLPGQAHNWPKGRAAWTETVSAPITVVPADQSPIGMTTDPKLDPQTTGAIHINTIRVIRKGTGQRVTVDMYLDGKTVPCSFDIVLRIAGKEHPLGYLVGWSTSNYGTELAADFESLDASVTSADVLLRPNVKHAEGIAGIDQIWGKPVDLLNIPLTRYDLQGK